MQKLTRITLPVSIVLVATLSLGACGGSGGGGSSDLTAPKLTMDVTYDAVFRYTCDSETLPCPPTPDLNGGIYSDGTVYVPGKDWQASPTKIVAIDLRAIDIGNLSDILIRLTFDVDIVDDGGGVVSDHAAGKIITFDAVPGSPVAGMNGRVLCMLDSSGEGISIQVSGADAAGNRTWLGPIDVVLQ